MRIAFIIAITLAACSLAAAEGSDEPSWHLRLTWHEDPATAITISFDVQGDGETGVVMDENAHEQAESYAQRLQPQLSGQYLEKSGSDATVDWRYHHISVRDLKPDTVYHFRLVTEGRVSRDFHFRTMPVQPQELRFAQGGDSRSRADVRRGINDLISELSEAGTIDFLAHAGDFIGSGKVWSHWQGWLEDHQRTITADGRVLPLIVAQGNHERGGPSQSQYWAVFGMPPSYYQLKFGKLMRFITLNTEAAIGGKQTQWLEELLPEARQTTRWLYAQLHRPIHPVVKNVNKHRHKYWLPLFEQHGVDVVYECDGHNYKVLAPIRDGAFSTDGVLYLGEGGWGAPQRSPKKRFFWTDEPSLTTRLDHIMVMEMTADALTVVGLDIKGEEFHRLFYPHERAGRLQAVVEQKIALPTR